MRLRRLFIRLAGVLGVLAMTFAFVQPTSAAEEVITDFSAAYILNKDGTVEVKELIEYNFGRNQRHGIFRDIPLTTENGPQLGILVNGVTDQFGTARHYVESVNNNTLHIKIGEADKLITGAHTYWISYTVTNAIRPFADHDEFYWNVTGNEWPVEIQKVEATVSFADRHEPVVNFRTDCFTGAAGSTLKNCAITPDLGQAEYVTTLPLGVKEGLTVVAGFPLGVVDDTVVEIAPPVSQDVELSGSDWLFLLIPLAVIIAFIGLIIFGLSRLFVRKGYRGPVVTAYQPPTGLLPIDTGTILDRTVDKKDISSMILDLAIRGYLKIHYTVKEIRFWPDKKDFELEQLKDGSTLTHPGEKVLFELLFSKGKTVLMSDLMAKAESYEHQIKDITAKTEEHLRQAGYFDPEAKVKMDQANKQLAVISAVVVGGVILLSFATAGLGILLIFPLVIFAIIRMVMTSHLANKLTPKGLEAQAKIAGFQEFLMLTEADRLRLTNAPSLQPDMFEQFLPYAMVLGAEEQWAAKFDGLYQSAPAWYDDQTHSAFSSTLLTHNLLQLNSAWSQVASNSVPRSSSSSGFSGGSSGGGSGGGGGGSW